VSFWEGHETNHILRKILEGEPLAETDSGPARAKGHSSADRQQFENSQPRIGIQPSPTVDFYHESSLARLKEHAGYVVMLRGTAHKNIEIGHRAAKEFVRSH